MRCTRSAEEGGGGGERVVGTARGDVMLAALDSENHSDLEKGKFQEHR